MMSRVQGYAHQHLVIPLVKTRIDKTISIDSRSSQFYVFLAGLVEVEGE